MLIQDLRYGVRSLLKSPGFTAVAILTLGLGIGANNAIFGLINSVLIKSLPYPKAEQLVSIWETVPNGSRNGVSAAVFLDWRDNHGSTKISHLALYKDINLNLTGAGVPEQVSGLQVTAAYLSVLGVSPVVGRGFSPGEDERGSGGNGNQVVLLANHFWQTRFASDPNVVGKTLILNQLPHTVIGVLPPGALLREEHKFLVPFTIGADSDVVKWVRGYHCCGVVARLAEGASPADAQAELRGIRQQLASLYPPYKKNWGVDVLPLQEDLTGDIRSTLLMLLATAGFVLLIACANVSNLLLARGNTHARELAIRKALGASSGRIVRQLLVESLLLAGGGCVLGLILASFGIKLLTRLLVGMVPQILHPELDLNVLAFSIVSAAVCGLIFGLMPAIRATTRPDLNHVMKESGRGAGGSQSGSRRRSQAILIVSEFAFTLVLLVGAGLFVRSFMKLLEADPGFQPAGALAFDLSFSRAKYPKAEDQQRLLADIQNRISALPGVDASGAATFLPLSRRDNGEGVRRQDRTDTENLNVGNVFVSGDYFTAMGMRLQRGRVINEADNVPGAAPVLVIDTTVAGRLFAEGEDPIGKQIRFLGKPWEVVGVVSPVRHGAMNVDPRARIYGPRGMASYPTSSIVVRSALPPSALIDSVRNAIQGADPDQPVSNVRTLEEAVYRSLTTQRTSMILVGLFAMLAISLACVGIYGVMSYAVGQRARELSIRAALGANKTDIVQLVLNGGLRLSFVGIGAGLIVAYFLARLVEKLLFGIQVHDPLVFVGSVLLLATVAALSIYLPARRAASLDPILALRSE